MAKYERELYADFDTVLDALHRAAMSSASSSYEDASDWAGENGARVAVRVYERYSMFGSNRVSLSVTLAGDGGRLFLSMITSGGSEAVIFKINTLGEESFLARVARAFEREFPGEGR